MDSIPPGIKSDDFDSKDDDNSTSNPSTNPLQLIIPDSEKLSQHCGEMTSPEDFESTIFLLHSPRIDTLLTFSSENEDKVFNHGVLASKEKSPPSSSHRGFKASKLFLHESPMLIHHDNTPNLDFPDCDDSRARGYVLHSLELHILSFILGIQYPNLSI
ncbi:hypothetical protein Tco_0173621 [Tanacetum coccineum]